MPFSVRSACVKAVTLSGTSWSRSLRRVAVTTMSAGLVAESVLFAVAASAGRLSSAGAAPVWAAAGAAAEDKAPQRGGAAQGVLGKARVGEKGVHSGLNTGGA